VTLANYLFSLKWGNVIGGARLVAAIVAAVTFNAHVIETGTES